MSRLLVHVEGQTEETFVNELLRPHLTSLGWSMVDARLLGNARRRDRRPSGWNAWSADTRSRYSALLRHWKSGSQRFGANAPISATGSIYSNNCRVPWSELLLSRTASGGARAAETSPVHSSAVGSPPRRRTISSRASGALVRNSRCVRLPRQAGRRGGSGNNASTSSRSKS